MLTQIGGRRKFFSLVRNLLAAGGFAGQARLLEGAQAATRTEDGEDYYDKLGVTKIINAAGTSTALTASTMPPSVQAASVRICVSARRRSLWNSAPVLGFHGGIFRSWVYSLMSAAQLTACL